MQKFVEKENIFSSHANPDKRWKQIKPNLKYIADILYVQGAHAFLESQNKTFIRPL